MYPPSTWALFDLTEARQCTFITVCFLHYIHYGLFSCGRRLLREIALMSHPPICVGLLENVQVRKISVQRGICSSQSVSTLTAIIA